MNKELNVSIKAQKKICFTNKCGCVVDYALLENAILKKANGSFVVSKRPIYLSGKYAAIAIGREKYHVHRLLYEFLNGNIPKGYHIHHIDGNKLNNKISNFELVLGSKHTSSHNKGKCCSDSARNALIKYNKAKKGTRQPFKRKDVTYQNVQKLLQAGYSINKISIALKTDWDTIKLRIKDIHDTPELLNRKE
jgi:hypothetical protein